MCLGVPGRITQMSEVAGMPIGKVDFGGVSRDVCLAYVPEAQLGEYVIVHVGFAISIVDADEAERTLEILRTMGDLLDQELSPEKAL